MKLTIIAGIIGIAIIGGALLLASRSDASGIAKNGDNVRIVDGKQIIELSAKGGYYPKKNIAKPGIPTVLRVATDGTFDCSSSIRIPSMSISTFLPPSGTTDIDLGSPRTGALAGTCGMGMYSFRIDFQN